jgi:protein SCO1/2
MTMRKLHIIPWVFLAMALIVSSYFYYANRKSGDDLLASGFKIGGPFAMTDQNGNAVTEKAYAGNPMAIFFGFTYCPDICPTTLSRLSTLIEKLGPLADKIQVILVSVDPERDTPAVLKTYLEAFNPRFVGLTGTPEQLADFAKRFRAFYERAPAENGEYTMNHTAGILLFDSKGGFTGTLDPHEEDNVALQKLRNLAFQ